MCSQTQKLQSSLNSVVHFVLNVSEITVVNSIKGSSSIISKIQTVIDQTCDYLHRHLENWVRLKQHGLL